MIKFLILTVLSPEVVKIFQIKKIQIFDKSNTDILDLIGDCFGSYESCQKLYFKQLLSP